MHLNYFYFEGPDTHLWLKSMAFLINSIAESSWLEPTKLTVPLGPHSIPPLPPEEPPLPEEEEEQLSSGDESEYESDNDEEKERYAFYSRLQAFGLP